MVPACAATVPASAETIPAYREIMPRRVGIILAHHETISRRCEIVFPEGKSREGNHIVVKNQFVG